VVALGAGRVCGLGTDRLRRGRRARSSVRYPSVAAPQEPLRQRLRELAQTRVAYGYRRLHVLLCCEGWPVNLKRIQRLYRDEGLTQRAKGRSGGAAAGPHAPWRGQRALGDGLHP
jgi:putative transposase